MEQHEIKTEMAGPSTYYAIKSATIDNMHMIAYPAM
jgi:hypothetical protein